MSDPYRTRPPRPSEQVLVLDVERIWTEAPPDQVAPGHPLTGSARYAITHPPESAGEGWRFWGFQDGCVVWAR